MRKKLQAEERAPVKTGARQCLLRYDNSEVSAVGMEWMKSMQTMSGE